MIGKVKGGEGRVVSLLALSLKASRCVPSRLTERRDEDIIHGLIVLCAS